MLLHGWTVYKYCIRPATADTPHKAWLLWGTGQLLSPRPYLVASLVSNQCGSAYDQPLCGVPSRHTYLGLPTEPSHIWEHCVQIIYFSQRKKYLVKTTKVSERSTFFWQHLFMNLIHSSSIFHHKSIQQLIIEGKWIKEGIWRERGIKVGSSFISCCCCWPGTGNQARNNSVQASQQNFVEIPITWYGWFITMSCYWFAYNLTFSILGWHSILRQCV